MKYSGARWRSARAAAISRDDCRCQSCGRSDALHVHHVEPIREFDNPIDAHYLDNLVTLCKKCHPNWEGRRVRPELLDKDTETSTAGIVGGLVASHLTRLSMSLALPEILLRQVAFNESICSNCLKRISPIADLTIFGGIYSMCKSIAYREATLPQSERIEAGPLTESFCAACKDSTNRSQNVQTRVLSTSGKPARDSRAFWMGKYLRDCGFGLQTDLQVTYGRDWGDNVLKQYRGRGELQSLSYAVSEALSLPILPLKRISVDRTAPDRWIEAPESGSDADKGYPDWFTSGGSPANQ
jgi:hypothetical protein